jgi:hypothetical protein
MQTPLCLGHPWINGEGLIDYLIFRETLGDNYYNLPTNQIITPKGLPESPLKKSCYNGISVAHCSVAQFDIGLEQAGTVTVYKRFDESTCHKIDTTTRKINIGSGQFKAYAMKLPYLPATKVEFYCCGDMEEITRLIGYLTGLGKKTVIGFGAIKSVSVEEIATDYSLYKDFKAMRPLPCAMGFDSTDKMVLAYKTPYWAKENHVSCVPPGALLTKIAK